MLFRSKKFFFSKMKLLTEFKGNLVDLKKYNTFNLYKFSFHLPIAAFLMSQEYLFFSFIICYFASSNIAQYMMNKRVLNNNINKILLDKENLLLEIHIGVYKPKILRTEIINLKFLSNIDETIEKIKTKESFLFNMLVTDIKDKNEYLITLTIDNINNLIINLDDLIIILKKDLNLLKENDDFIKIN